MNRKITLLTLLLTVALLYGLPSASGRSGYLDNFNQQYNTAGTRLDSCGVCHVNPGGGGPVNPYGRAFAAAGSFASIESLDSDGDGFTNIAEINARTFPGDPNDHPATGATLTPAAITRLNDSADNASEELVDDIEPYEGSIGPGSALYGLKIAFENIDEAFTFNASEKLGKRLEHAKQRISEAKAELMKENNEAALRALEQYREEIKLEEDSISGLGEDDSLEHAQRAVVKHQYVLEKLLESHPNNTGLERAYNNSRMLEEEFQSRTELKFQRVHEKDGREVLKKERLEAEETKVVAEVFGNVTEIKVEVKFRSNSTDNFTIAQNILDKMRSSTENLANVVEIKIGENEEKELKTKLEAEAEVKKGFTKVGAEYSFPLNVTNRSDIIAGINLKLAALTRDDVLKALEIKSKEEREDENEGLKEHNRTEKEGLKEQEHTENEGMKEHNRTEKEGLKKQEHTEKEGIKDRKNNSIED